MPDDAPATLLPAPHAPRLARVRDWRLHVGAHKTATTHMQDNLAAWRGPLAAQGVDFIPMEAFRALRLPPPAGRGDWRLRLRGLGMIGRLRREIDRLRIGPERVAISEENLLGLAPELFGPELYARSAPRLRAFAGLALRSRATVFLSIRRLDDLMASAYVETLRFQPRPGGFAPIKARLLDRPPTWTDLVERLTRLLPGFEVRVWTFEDYVREPRSIMTAFSGAPMPDGPLPAPEAPARTRTPSARALVRIEVLDPGLPKRRRFEIVRDIIDDDLAHGGGEKFQPFAPEERERLRAAWDADLDRLDRLFPRARIRIGEEGRD